MAERTQVFIFIYVLVNFIFLIYLSSESFYRVTRFELSACLLRGHLVESLSLQSRETLFESRHQKFELIVPWRYKIPPHAL